MELDNFTEVSAVYAKTQPQYVPLPAFQHCDKDGTITCCWRLTFWERARLLFTGRIWHSIKTFGMPLQPQRLELDKPEMHAEQPLLQKRVAAKVEQASRPWTGDFGDAGAACGPRKDS